MLRCPQRGRIAVIDGSRKCRFRSQPIIDREHRAVPLDSKSSTDGVVAIDTAEHPTSPMKVHEQRTRYAIAMRAVKSCCDRSVAARNGYVARNGDGRGW